MEVSMIKWKGVAVGVYRLNEGEKVPRHQHAWEHTIYLVQGTGEVEVYDDKTIKMEIGENYTLPANIDHEIRAFDDKTIMIAMADDNNVQKGSPLPAASGGVLHDDGRVVRI